MNPDISGIEALEEEVGQSKEGNKRLRSDNQSTDIIKCMKDIQNDLRTRFVRLDELVHNPGLGHIARHIFNFFDIKTLGKCRQVSRGWKSFIDNDKHWWSQVLLEGVCLCETRAHRYVDENNKHDFCRLDELIHNPGLALIASNIFKYLDPQSLGRCRRVSKGWKTFIDNDRS